MLLHSHGITSWYPTFLTFATWLISNVLFSLLLRRLSTSTNNTEIFDKGVEQLFQISSCGGSSAMTLCQQTHGIDPLHYLTLFYNQRGVPNVRTIPALWAWSSFILAILVGIQLYSWTKKTSRSSNLSLKKTNRRRLPWAEAVVEFSRLPVLVFFAVVVASIIFGLALGYQAQMVIRYSRMDVIDWDGWTFGQVVALLFWVPLLLECIHSCIGEYLEILSCALYQHLLPSRAVTNIPHPYRQCLAFQRIYSGSVFQFKRTFISNAI